MTTQKLLTRKDIANLLGISPRQVRDNERRLGLLPFRAKLNNRCVFYQGWRAVPHLQKIGLLS
jgi:hypothetical protein